MNRFRDEEKRYNQVPAPEIQTSGIADLMSEPADGENRNSHINWLGACFAVQASIERDGRPHHQIIVDYPDTKSETGRYTQGMSVKTGEDGLPEAVATVSGGHPEGVGRLSDRQKRVMAQLVQRSIDAGEIQR